MVMRDIRASVEVRALIGASRLRELQGKASTRYECWQCGSQGRTTDATSVIVVGHRAFRVVMLAHADCAESHIIEVGVREHDNPESPVAYDDDRSGIGR